MLKAVKLVKKRTMKCYMYYKKVKSETGKVIKILTNMIMKILMKT